MLLSWRLIDEFDLLGFPLVEEVYLLENLDQYLVMMHFLEFKHSRSSQTSSSTIGLSNGKLLLTYKFYDYETYEKTHQG